jgi:hypothetical protein
VVDGLGKGIWFRTSVSQSTAGVNDCSKHEHKLCTSATKRVLYMPLKLAEADYDIWVLIMLSLSTERKRPNFYSILSYVSLVITSSDVYLAYFTYSTL